MTFTYTLATDIGKLRLKLGDRTSGSGPRPDGTNLTDEELQVLLTEGGSVDAALVLACETLANEWSSVSDLAVGSVRESASQAAKAWAARATELRTTLAGAWSFGRLNLDFIEPEATT